MSTFNSDEGFHTFIMLGLASMVDRANGRDFTDQEVKEYEEWENMLKWYQRYQQVRDLPHWAARVKGMKR